jgi:hypothetical protein
MKMDGRMAVSMVEWKADCLVVTKELVMVEVMAEWKVDELALPWAQPTVVLTVRSSVEWMAEGMVLLKDDY